MRTRLFKMILFLCIIMASFVVSYFGDVIYSMTNSGASSTVDGSSADLRLLQWECCLPDFLHSPIWGNGRMYLWNGVAPYNSILLGAESICFSLLVNYGIMGAATYTFMIICSIFLLHHYDVRLCFTPIGYFLILTLSPDTDIQHNVLLCFIVLSIRIVQYFPILQAMPYKIQNKK